MGKKRLGLLTFHCATNYGGVLQTYALSQVLKSLGYSVKLINLRPPNISNDKPKRLTDFFFRVLFNRFVRKYLPEMTGKINSQKDLLNLNNDFDIFIVGSDQIWNPLLSRNYIYNYFFDFVENSKKKISYAASFGLKEVVYDEVTREKIKELIKRFDYVTVREESGKNICEEYFNVKAEVVADPTLLLTDYSSLLKHRKERKEGVVCIKFIKSQEFVSMANYLGNKLDCKVKLINTPKRFKGIKSVYYPKVESWLSLIKNAELVITDSFHGLCFCLLYNKNFIIIPGKIERFTRLQNLLESLGLENRVYNNLSELESDKSWQEPIDYDIVNGKIANIREKSLQVLQKAIKMDN